MSSLKERDRLRNAAAQMLMVGFHTAPSAVPESLGRALAEGLGGVILFRRNIEDVHQLMDLTASIRQAAPQEGPVPFVAVDQEGGRVVRLREPLTPIPPMRTIGEQQDPEWTRAVSAMMALELKTLGINLNFAPVVDVDTNPKNPVIGDRSFSSDPRQVARHARAFIAGHLETGILPCAKHFPGHGDTLIDSHLDLPSLPHDLQRLEETELHPFKELFRDDPPLLMTAHILFQALDTQHPATLSHLILEDLLRRKLGYKGLIISDCLEMKAVSQRYTIEEMMELGLSAGIDIFLICHTEELWQRAWEHLLALGEQNQENRDRILSSAHRIERRKEQILTEPLSPESALSTLGCKPHRDLLTGFQSNATDDDPTDTSA